VAKNKGKGNTAVIEAPEEADEDVETEDVELDIEDTDEAVVDDTADVEEDSKPAKGKGKGGASEEVEFGASDLAAHLTKLTGKPVSTRDLRTQIRRMARETERDGGPRVKREITAGNRTRYNWKGGLKNPEVKAIIAAVTGGELEEGKKAALDALKAKKAAEKAAGGGSKKGKKGKKGKAAAEDISVEDDD
jgi:hypothetical protein